MGLIKYLLIGAGLCVSVMGEAISFSEWPASLTVGQPVTLKWVGGSNAPTTITLRKGPSTDLQNVQVLTSDATNGQFTWTPPADLQNANDYAFQISQGTDINYTGLLPLSGGSETPNINALNKAQTDSASTSNTASATGTAASSMESDMTATGTGTTAASGTTTQAPTMTESASSAMSSASGSMTTGSNEMSSSEVSSAMTTASSAMPSESATSSKMNTPYTGSSSPTSSSSSSSSAQTGSAVRATISASFLAGSAALLLFLLQ